MTPRESSGTLAHRPVARSQRTPANWTQNPKPRERPTLPNEPARGVLEICSVRPWAPRAARGETLDSYTERVAHSVGTSPLAIRRYIAAHGLDQREGLARMSGRDTSHLAEEPHRFRRLCYACSAGEVVHSSIPLEGLFCLHHRQPHGFPLPAGLDIKATIRAEVRYRHANLGRLAPIGSQAFFHAAAPIIWRYQRSSYNLDRALKDYPRIVSLLELAAASQAIPRRERPDDGSIATTAPVCALFKGRVALPWLVDAIVDSMDFEKALHPGTQQKAAFSGTHVRHA